MLHYFFSSKTLAVYIVLHAFLAADFALAAEKLTVYSYRKAERIEAVFRTFEARTRIKVRIVSAKKGLIERIVSEGTQSPADVLITNEFGLLTKAKSLGLTYPVSSSILNQRIPQEYRDPEGYWFGLTRHARVVFASKDRISQENITLEELTDPQWRGKICIRSGYHTYNTALVASIIAHHGRDEAERWLRGLKKNLARKPTGNDRHQMRGVYEGVCDLAIANSYYMAATILNIKEPEQKKWARSVRILFPNAKDRGTHINISGAALLKHAPNKVRAIQLIEYLSSDIAQRIYATLNFEYPIRDGIPVSGIVKSWGDLYPDPMPLFRISKLRIEAEKLVEEIRFDVGPGG